MGGGEKACAAAATRPKFIEGGADAPLSVDGGGDPVDEAATALPARWMPAARARDVAGFAKARCAAVKAAAACTSVPSEAEVGPARERRSGLDVKYLWRIFPLY